MTDKDKKILALIIIAAIVYILASGCIVGIKIHIQKQEEQARIDHLVDFAEKNFRQNDFDDYMAALRKYELDDLNAELSSRYSIDEKNVLTVWIELTNITSKEIDSFYTTKYEDTKSILLAGIMRAIAKNSYEVYTYESESGDLVETIVFTPGNHLKITSPSGHVYEYDYGISNWDTVKVDDEWVYNEQVPETYIRGWNQGECIHSNCDFDAKEGSNYCSRHGCCKDNCPNEKDVFVHCCSMHSCIAPGCGKHRYDYAKSEYCNTHYKKQFD